MHLVPRTGLVPDFLTPMQGLESVDAGVEAIRATRRSVIRDELRVAYAPLPATPLRRRLIAGDREVLDRFAATVRGYFEAVFAQDWTRLVDLHRTEVARQGQNLTSSGVDGLLAGLHPAIRWHAPTLEVDTWWSGDVDLGGRGLLLAPSILAGPRPRVLIQRAGPALLMYPVAGWLVGDTAGPAEDPLRALLGRTRAEVLRHLGRAGRHTTTEVAGALAIGPASASEHASALRAAGLVDTARQGRSVLHRLTALGTELLHHNASTGASAGRPTGQQTVGLAGESLGRDRSAPPTANGAS